MHHFKIVSASLMIGLAPAACQPTKSILPRDDEKSTRPVNKSSNAALADLSLSAGTLTPAFAEGTTAYTIDVAYATEKTTVTATLADAKASVALRGTALSSKAASADLPLSVGATEFKVVVTAEDGTTTRTYTVTVNRPAPSADATLSALVFSAGTFAFAASTTTYAFDVTPSVTSITVTATTTQTSASLKIQGSAATSGQASQAISLRDGKNLIDLVVTAQDGTTKKIYQVTITKLTEAADATPSALVPSVDTALVPAFLPFHDDYNVDVPNNVSEIAFTPAANHTGATITLDGTKVRSGQSSATVSLPTPRTYEVSTSSLGKTARRRAHTRFMCEDCRALTSLLWKSSTVPMSNSPNRLAQT